MGIGNLRPPSRKWLRRKIPRYDGTAGHHVFVLDPVSQNLEQYMTLLSTRQKVVASNIANADTPGYKTQDVDFQSALQAAGSGSLATPTEVAGLRIKNDGNNVNLDRESRLLAENAMRFSFASNLLKSQIKVVRLAIEGGSTSA
jgi:flagellar basal-body rod protein FlgB